MGRDRQRGTTSLRRRVGVRRPRKTIAIFCEGERTEPEYLEALKRQPAVRDVAAVDLRIDTQHLGSVPLTLVRLAVGAKERAAREEGEIDEFWCVFDVEWPTNHPGLREALELASRYGIHTAVSNPCFELWLALHFQDHRAWLDNDAARRLRRSHDRQVDKGLKGADYMAHIQLAASRAAALEQWHADNGTRFPHDNPSSGMHRLIISTTLPPSF
ncbi:RloB family protein [Micromonospora sp. NPDC000316]|uniref:RloB family protein n=1 Tax=Micromonospora sp. NPDC000316 TaxID=3364216 RepID=UPI003693B30E